MNNTLNLIRAARGPVQLIVLGSIFLLSYHQIAGIWQTWPVLLISFGLMKLVEWLYQRSLSPEGSGPGGGFGGGPGYGGSGQTGSSGPATSGQAGPGYRNPGQGGNFHA